MATTRAKFKCVEKETDDEGQARIRLDPVTNGSAENESFFRYTPGGWIDLSVVNPSAADQFIPGQEYYVDFTLAPRDQAESVPS